MKEDSWKDLLSFEVFTILFGLFSFLFIFSNFLIYEFTDGEKYTGNYLAFNNNATYLDKKMIINVIFEQIEFTVDCI